jgi:hypothetical protein
VYNLFSWTIRVPNERNNDISELTEGGETSAVSGERGEGGLVYGILSLID